MLQQGLYRSTLKKDSCYGLGILGYNIDTIQHYLRYIVVVLQLKCIITSIIHFKDKGKNNHFVKPNRVTVILILDM